MADLAHLLEDLRRQKALVTPQELEHRLPPVLATGLGPLDELLGGGLPEGRVTGLRGPGATAVAAAVVAAVSKSGRLAAWIDRPDALDPRSAAAAGVDLARLLWCRPGTRKDALRSADALLASRAFGLVVLDLAAERHGSKGEPGSPARAVPPKLRPVPGGELRGRDRRALRPELVLVDQEARPLPGPPARGRIEDRGSGLTLVRWAEPGQRPRTRRPDADPAGSAWVRLARVAEEARAALLVMGGEAGTFAAADVRASRARPRFSGSGPGSLFDGLLVSLSLERSRLGLSPGRSAELLLEAPPHFPAR